ncbi:hypothetical protein DCAR_0207642 [Daucus carota subsp. sativus]|uniref:Growth-regulating factor n=1 Tax=Daucus carota subsp. sativus TaxID=79200 RepID=A0AAF0WF57_DAUCS|nr:hypothetical protein DCAR_0207642 [Daucus carota subsp. sativus]
MEPCNPSSKIARIAEHGSFIFFSADGHYVCASIYILVTNNNLFQFSAYYAGRESRICDKGRPRSNCSFTFLQLEELKDQVLIYKYIENAIPVPHHLLVPICKSVAHSLNGLEFVGGLDCCNYRKNMEPEPGRCRRTDGKKWRCNRDVARPDQKYCDRHLHRGGSRLKQQHNSGGEMLPAKSVSCIPNTTDALN